jgi:hypothetical protein
MIKPVRLNTLGEIDADMDNPHGGLLLAKLAVSKTPVQAPTAARSESFARPF